MTKAALLKPLVAAVSAALCCAPAWANPTGAQVVNGTISLQRPNAQTLNVTNSPGSIIHWQGFSIGAGEITRFIQQSTSSGVLNRVVGADISQIHGQLLSNGRVFLINPAGILIGGGAVIDTGGFVASTINMSNADFLAGKLRFQGDGSAGSINNQGWIKASGGGNVVLIAPQIENSGAIDASGGQVILAAGQKVTIASGETPSVQFEVQAPTDSIVNIGKLIADGGAVGVFAGTLKHSGDIRANALTRDEAGRIVLKAQNIKLAAGSTIAANGKAGGTITIQSADSTLVSGTVEATGSESRGGFVQILGNKVGVLDGAVVNASGDLGGGTVLVGGDYLGGNPGVKNSFATYIGPAAMLRADATTLGDGGRVIVWSDKATRVHGGISVRGGAGGGNGGFVETSGGYLDVTAIRVSATAPKGNGGLWLIDPNDITIVAGADTNIDATGSPVFTTTTNSASLSPATIQTQLNNGVSVTVTTGTAAPNSQAGDIHVSDPVTKTLGGNAQLRLNAHNDIHVNASITSSSGHLDMVFNPNSDNAGGGVLNFRTTTLNANGGTISAAGKTVNFTALSNAAINSPISFSRMNIDGGSVTFNDTVTSNSSLNIDGGIVRFNGASSFDGGVNLTAGTLGGNGSVTTNDLSWTGGTIASPLRFTDNGFSDIQGPALTLGGVFNANGNNIRMRNTLMTIASTGQLTFNDLSTIDNTTLQNSGIVRFNGTADTQLDNITVIQNQSTGTFEFQNNFGLELRGGTTSFINQGTLLKTGAGTTSTLFGIDLDNRSGANLRVQSGTLFLQAGTFQPNAGTVRVDTGAVLQTNTAITNAINGSVRGGGTINLGGGTLTNQGTVSPGASPGTLTILGNYVQTATGILAVELGGTQQGVTYDLLQVNGAATLNGTLQVTMVNGFTGSPGTPYDVMTYNSRTGDFSTFDYQTAGTSFQPSPQPLFYQLVQQTAAVTSRPNSGNDVTTENERMKNALPEENLTQPEEEKRPRTSAYVCS